MTSPSGTPGASPSGVRSRTAARRGWWTSTTCPTTACSGGSRRATTSTFTRFLAEHDLDVAGGRVLMAANARAFGYCFNPISVFWCWDAAGDLAATVVEVHNTYGDRHAYLRPPRRAGSGDGAEGDVRLAVPRHRGHLRAGGAGAGRPPGHRGHAGHRRRRHGSARRCPAVARRPVRSGPPRLPCGAPYSSGSTASGCGCAGSPSNPAQERKQ